MSYSPSVEGPAWRGQRIRSADPSTFEVLGGILARDAHRVFVLGKPYPVVHRPSFEVLSPSYARDEAAVYVITTARLQQLPGADPATFVAVGERYGRDGARAYCYNRPLPLRRGACLADLRELAPGIATDGHALFFGTKAKGIPEALGLNLTRACVKVVPDADSSDAGPRLALSDGTTVLVRFEDRVYTEDGVAQWHHLAGASFPTLRPLRCIGSGQLSLYMADASHVWFAGIRVPDASAAGAHALSRDVLVAGTRVFGGAHATDLRPSEHLSGGVFRRGGQALRLDAAGRVTAAPSVPRDVPRWKDALTSAVISGLGQAGGSLEATNRTQSPGTETKSRAGHEDRMAAMHEPSAAAGVSCLDTEWQGVQHNYRFRCANGHEWLRRGDVQRRIAHCPACPATRVLLGELTAGADGISCLDSQSTGPLRRYGFVCGSGHEWKQRGSSARLKLCCPTCSGESAGPSSLFDRMLQRAAAAGVVCLDTVWHGVKYHYRFRCSYGHEWQRRGDAQTPIAGCPACSRKSVGLGNRNGDNFARLHELARQRGGACLSAAYEGRAGTCSLRCAEGHEWTTTAAVILSGKWCPRCKAEAKRLSRRRADGLENLMREARSRGGECLSGEYLGGLHRYRFRCGSGHEWTAAGTSLLAGSWCGPCAVEASRSSIEDVRAEAVARGGRCLSELYVRCDVKLHWLCGQGHDWHATWSNVKRGSWCPQCAILARITTRKSMARRKYVANGKLDLQSEPSRLTNAPGADCQGIHGEGLQ